MTNNFCIYRHLKKNGEVFYIGIGNIKRPYQKYQRNSFWHNTVNKYPDYEIQILKSDLSLEEAKELEIILIAYYGRKNLGLGTLTNLTDGGEGTVGYKPTPETLLKMSAVKKGKTLHSKEWKDKLSTKWLGENNPIHNRDMTGENNPNYGKGLSRGKNGKAKRVRDTVTNKEYDCLQDAAYDLKIKYQTLRNYMCGKRRNKTNLIYI